MDLFRSLLRAEATLKRVILLKFVRPAVYDM